MGEWSSLHVPSFDLARTIKSGQCLRYHQDGERFIVPTRGIRVRLAQDGAKLHYAGASEPIVRELLGLCDEHRMQCARLSRDVALTALVSRYRTLRIMRLDAHETMLAFICSSNSNIPRIRQSLERLAMRCGKLGQLPAAGVVLDDEGVRGCGLGYRAPFIAAASRMATPAFLARLRTTSYPEAHDLLLAMPGVGPKVADCICLFALGHGQAFPVDVHVHRALRALFPRSRLSTAQRARDFAQRRWGADAGLAQQFLFSWARERLRLQEGVIAP
jgi:N-glycosylase/DNA lyase